MRVPLSWLRDFAPIEAPAEDLTTTLNELGLIVDGVERIGEGLEAVVVARVLDIRPIPGAERIRHVTVDAGGEPVDVVCGAWNFEVGDLVPLAPVGAVLPNGMEIARRKMKGAVSNGMLCSAAELHLADDAAGLLVLPPGLHPGTPVAEALGIAADVVFELDITPNRPDAMSVAGVARDLAAALKVPFSIPETPVEESGPPASSLTTVVVEDPDLCPLFSARVLTEVKMGESPDWLARRLTLSGMRAINSVVDASNYVMLELGQPNHPYDLDRLAGGGLRVRAARAGEKVRTLDGVERQVGRDGARDCLICDAEDTPVGLAGIMGGEATEISPDTTRVLLEVAYFTPMVIARTSKRLGLRSEASARFERGCDPDIVERAAARVSALLAQGGAARVASGAVTAGRPPERTRLRLRTGRVNRVLGVRLTSAAVRGYLEPIGFTVSGDEGAATGDEGLAVEVPGWRPDVAAEIDLVEEVARHHGYSRIERTVPTTTQVGALTRYQRERRLVRDVMVGAGLVEVWTPSLVGAADHDLAGLEGADVQLANPMSREESVLRRSMLPGLLRALRHNTGHRNRGLRFFEVGRVFADQAGSGLPAERELLTVVLHEEGDDAGAAVRLWRTLAEALRLAEPALDAAAPPALHPTRSATASAGGTVLGTVGEVDPAVAAAFELTGRVGWLEVDLDALGRAPRRSTTVVPVTVYPTSDIDLAFVVPDEVPAAAVEATLRAAAGSLLQDLGLFDVYRDPAQLGEGRRSLAFRLRFGALDRTLTDPEVAEVRARGVRAVESEHGAALRG